MKRRSIAVWVLASLFCWSSSFGLASGQLDFGLRTSSIRHACCRHAHHPVATEELFGFAPFGIPCGDEHPCCTYRSPENRSSLPTIIRVPAPEVRLSIGAAAPGDANAKLAIAYSARDLQPHFLRSMVLRI